MKGGLYNTAGGSSNLLGGYDLNTSGAKRYEQMQVFDSQVSQSHENSQELQRYYDSGLNHSEQLKRADTEPVRHQQVSFATHKRDNLIQMRSTTQLERIEEDRQMRSSSRTRTQNHGNHMKSNNDLEPIISQSNKLEESVQQHGRLPQRVPGLTNFLCEQHYKKTGVFTKTQNELHKFWKKHVSVVYKLRQEQKLAAANNLTYLEQTHNTSNANLALGTSFKSQTLKENMPVNSEKGIFAQYKKYERLYEMDVVFTLQKDLEEEQEAFKKMQLQREYDWKKSIDNQLKQQEIANIKWMIEQYYDDLKVFMLNEIKEKDEKIKLEKSKGNPSWHKTNTTHSARDTINPVESLDEDRKEPQLPTIPQDYEKEKERIEKALSTEQNFMLSLFLMAREEGLTNDPGELIRMYKAQKEKARLGIVWAKGDDDAEKLIKLFFKPERFIKRLKILYEYRNRQGQCGHLSLFGFFLQLKKRERLLCLIDWKPVRRQKQQESKQAEEHKIQPQSEQLTFEDRIYSVEEILEEYLAFEKRQMQEIKNKQQSEFEKSQKKHKEKLLKQVFGDEKKKKLEEKLNSKKNEEYLKELAKPKDKWKRGRILLELKKKFPHDIVLQKMIKEEFKENRVFKYPEEYDIYDDEEDRVRKYRGKTGIVVKEIGAGKSLREKFKILDDQQLYYLKKEISDKRKHEREMEQFIVDKVMRYLEKKKKRLLGENETVRSYVSDAYNSLVQKFPKLAKERFPHLTYGTKKDSETYKKSFPNEFKRYFFQLVKSFVKTEKGLKKLRYAPATFIIPGGKRCTMHQYECPQDCKYTTLNSKILLRSTIYKRKQKEPNPFRSRIWRRNDFKDALNKVLMCRSDLENCTFEPEAGSMSKNLEITLQANPNLKREGFLDEPDPEAYFKKLGKNFESSHPEVYKAGVLKRARLKYSQGKFEEAMNILCDGFNIESIKKRFDPHYMQRLIADQMKKKREERQAKEREEQKKLELSKFSMSQQSRLVREEHESQKKRPEEDYENKKLIPILREAFDLVTIIENRKKEAEKKIAKIRKSQRDLTKQMRSFSQYKRSMTRTDPGKGEKILFKTIMCPLREKCPKDKKPRWPTSNIKSNTQFGTECPFAHHPMELKFPETIIVKLNASVQMIKNIESKISVEKPKEVFKPTGTLFDCRGCGSKSGKHIGGPCNLCRYKEMANESTLKFTNKERMRSLQKSMERRETVEAKEEKKEMQEIMKALDLDNNYTKKFGLMKKACVLHFYGRFNDAFDEIAKAAKIIQDQKEIEKQKQYILEKRWKFKLGLDEGFDLGIPIEQLDPSKVDEKFLRKMELNGVSLATVKQYIEMVSPMRNEEYSKHQFLNKCIEDFYLQCEGDIEDKQNTIKTMKKQVEKLDEEADLADTMAGSPEKSPLKDTGDGTFKFKAKKTKMCPHLQEKGKCQLKKDKKCPYAHNPIELDLIPVETKMKNLNGVISSQSQKLKNMKPLEPWKPAKSGDIEHTHLMDMSSKKRKRSDDEEEDDEDNEKRKTKTKKSIFERENIFRKPYESQD